MIWTDFTEEEMQIANKQIQRHLTTLVIREQQIKTK